MAEVTIHFEVDDCIQDCPFCQSFDTKHWACFALDPPMQLEAIRIPLPEAKPPELCPYRVSKHQMRSSKK